MRKNILYTIVGFLICHLGFGQKTELYSLLIKEASSLYQSKSYQESGEKYNEAFTILGNQEVLPENIIADMYNAACSWALSENYNATFIHLYKIAKVGKYTNYNHLISDTDLKSLYKDPRWEEVKRIVNENYEEVKPLSKDALIVVFKEYQKAYDKVFSSGSTIADIDKLYSFYTSDFEYNHPKYGGIYSRELLYNNTLKFLKKGNYNNGPKRITIKRIVGLEGIAVEQRHEGETKTTMTLFKFRKDKIYFVEEYW